MNNKNDKNDTDKIDVIAEQWVKLLLSQIKAKKQREPEDISDKN